MRRRGRAAAAPRSRTAHVTSTSWRPGRESWRRRHPRPRRPRPRQSSGAPSSCLFRQPPPQLRHRRPARDARAAALPRHRPAPLGPAQGRHPRRRDADRGGAARDARGDRPGPRAPTPCSTSAATPTRQEGPAPVRLPLPARSTRASCTARAPSSIASRAARARRWTASAGSRFDRIDRLCTPKLAALLTRRSTSRRWSSSLHAGQPRAARRLARKPAPTSASATAPASGRNRS